MSADEESAYDGADDGGERADRLVDAEDTSLDGGRRGEGDGGQAIGPAEGGEECGESHEGEEKSKIFSEERREKHQGEQGERSGEDGSGNEAFDQPGVGKAVGDEPEQRNYQQHEGDLEGARGEAQGDVGGQQLHRGDPAHGVEEVAEIDGAYGFKAQRGFDIVDAVGQFKWIGAARGVRLAEVAVDESPVDHCDARCDEKSGCGMGHHGGADEDGTDKAGAAHCAKPAEIACARRWRMADVGDRS